MPNGLTAKQMTERMYTALVGIDGKSGLVQAVEDAKRARENLHEKIAGVEKKMVTRGHCLDTRSGITDEIGEAIGKALNGRRRARGLVIKDIILGVLGAGGIGTVMLLYVLDKLH